MEKSILLTAIAPLLFGSTAASAASPDAPSGALLPGSAVVANNPPTDALVSRAHSPLYSDGWRCPPWFVWRNAGRQDWLCVEGFEADKIARENREAPKNWRGAPDGTRSCPPGLVRREAFNNDPVCVDPIRRALVHEMNLALYNIH